VSAQTKSTASRVKQDLAALAEPERAKALARFFKTGKGQYGEGDRFLGIAVPLQRKVATKHRDLPLQAIAQLLKSGVHEHRSVALAILVLQFKRADEVTRQHILDFYLTQTDNINNWDLVDSSGPYVAGQYLMDKPRQVLYRLAESPNLWERRIAIVSSLAFVKAGQLDDAFAMAELLLGDKHDLIHKAVGWVLREAGKISRSRQLEFIARHYGRIPRTALRYAIEHLAPTDRKRIVTGDTPSLWRTAQLKKSPPRLDPRRAWRNEKNKPT
jgi:3-methyladenine DNA glycosylase AlkD